MPVKWEDMKGDLFEVIICLTGVPKLSGEQQEQVVAMMRDKGHEMTWIAIRYMSSAYIPT
jgi:hypothetical protein